MRKERILAAAWILIAAVLVSSLMVLVGGRLHLVDDQAYEMLRRYEKVEAARSTIAENHYRETDESALMDGAIRGMLEAVGDPYTFYYTPEEMARHSDDLAGSYVGIGILLLSNEAGEMEVLRVYEGSPAAEAGIKHGDVIKAVDGFSLESGSLDAAVQRISGESGTQVQLRLKRNGAEEEVSLTRSSVQYSNIASSMLPGDIGYIAVFQFSGDAAQTFPRALASLQAQGMRALVIDLRSNPGGLLDDAVAIADEILPAGLLVYTEDRAGKHEEYFTEGDYCAVPLVVLVNSMSASASEILAAAVQDLNRGAVVGTQSYGKGIVQALVRFPEDGSGMQYTFSGYFTPNGRSIHGVGVTPDIIVEAGKGMRSLAGIPDMENDAQLVAAIKYLKTEMGE